MKLAVKQFQVEDNIGGKCIINQMNHKAEAKQVRVLKMKQLSILALALVAHVLKEKVS